MKPQRYLLFLGIVASSSQLSCDSTRTGPDEPPAPIVAIYGSAEQMNLPDSIRALVDGARHSLILHDVLLPNNCAVSFVIANVGPSGSRLDYSVADNGALGGFLDYTNGVGSIGDGQYKTITVSVDPRFTDSSFGGLVGSTLVLSIHTPGASNNVITPVSVGIGKFDDRLQQQLRGTWGGTWSGISGDSGTGTGFYTRVSGTWTLNVQSADWARRTASGTLTWNGSDAYWTLYDANGILNPVSHSYSVNKSSIFNGFNATLGSDSPLCEGHFWLQVAGGKMPYLPPTEWSDVLDPYGPDLRIAFSPGFGAVSGGSWRTVNYSPGNTYYSQSSGPLAGARSP